MTAVESHSDLFFSVSIPVQVQQKRHKTMPKDAVLLLSMFTLKRYLIIGLSLTLSLFNTLR